MTTLVGELLFTAARVVWLFAPLLFAAAVSGVVLRFDLLHGLVLPIDGGRSIGGRRIFGDHKTWRGVAVAVAASAFAAELQKATAGWTDPLWLVDYRKISPLCFGTAMGAGAMLGELPNSFVKRRVGIAPGQTATGWKAAVFYVWDQVDLLTGAWPALAPWVRPDALVFATSFVVAIALHPSVALIGYLIGARRRPR
jgi:hypothetical protein